MSNVKADLVGGSETTVTEHEGHHFWTIDNWKRLINCSSEDAERQPEMYSNVFEVQGEDATTRWRIKAFPKKKDYHFGDCLAFQLLDLNGETPFGSYQFESYVEDKYGMDIRHVVSSRPLPLDSSTMALISSMTQPAPSNWT